MKCWICGDEATTGEHMTKASDLRSMFGPVTQRAPLFFHTDERRNLPVPGINSAKLKFTSLLCARCNNDRTQPHDRAWAALSQYLRGRVPPIRPGTVVRLAPVFPGCVRASMLDVHLYFLKLFGCLIAEHSVPLDLAEFAQAILRGEAHPRVHIAFAVCDEFPVRAAGMTQIEARELQGAIRFASWHYYLGRLSANVMYADPRERRHGLVDSWHPSTVSKLIHIKKL